LRHPPQPHSVRGCICIVTLLLVCSTVGTSAAAVLFVRTTGSDDADGTSPGTAFKTIGHAAALLQNAGDRIIVGPGTYPEGNVTPLRNGINGRPIEFVADLSGTLTGDAAGPVVVRPDLAVPVAAEPAPTTGFLLFGRQYVVIDGFTIIGASDAGIQVRPSPDGVDSGTVAIVNSTTSGGRDGIDVTSSGTVTIDGNVIADNRSVGLSISGTPSGGAVLSVSNNQVTNNGGHGIFVSGASGGSIDDNLVSGNTGSGVLVRVSSDLAIVGNTVNENQDGGIGIDPSTLPGTAPTNFSIADNTVQKNTRYGISLVATGLVTVDGNLATQNTTAGISVIGGNAAVLTVRDNEVGPSGTDGIFLAGGSTVAVSGNTVRSSIGSAVRIRQSGSVTLNNNTLSGSGEAGVDAVSTGALVLQGNSLSGNATSGVSLVADTGGTIQIAVSHNTVTNNAAHGVFIAGAKGGVIERNDVNANGGNGLLLTASAQVSIVGNRLSGNRNDGIGIGSTSSPSAPSTGFVLTDNTVQATTKASINVVAGGSVSLLRNAVTNSGTGGIAVSGDGNTTVAVRNSRIAGSGSDGVFVSGAAMVTVDGTAVQSSVGSGIQVRQSSNATVTHNQVSTSTGAGINLTVSGTAEVSYNTVSQSTSTGLSVQATAEPITINVANNTIGPNGSHGIFVAGAAGGPIQQNQVTNNADTGILVRRSAGVSVLGNTVTGNQKGGIGVNPGDDPAQVGATFVVSDNQVQANGSGIDVVGNGSVTAERNVVAGSPTAGISVLGDGSAAMVLADNQVSSSGADGLSLTGGSPITLDGNSVQTSGGNAVRIRQCQDVTVIRNTLFGSLESGINAIATGNVTVDDNQAAQNAGLGISATADANASIAIDLASNTVRNNGRGGIFIAGASGGALVDNIVENTAGDGLVARGSTGLTVLSNQVRNSAGNGLAIGAANDAAGTNFILRDNQIMGSTSAGVSVYSAGDVQALSNTVLHSGTSGLSVQAVGASVLLTVTQNTVGSSGAQGVFLSGATRGTVENNTVFSSGDAGLILRADANLLVANNLVYANVMDGLSIGTAETASPNATVVHNTVYENGGWGLLLGSATAASPGAFVVNNIFHQNHAGGMAVARASADGYVSGFNINTNGYGDGTRASSYDKAVDPLFVNPQGADHRLGGDGFADDDFRLQQGRGGQSQNSPAVDAGSGPTADVGITGSTAEHGYPDVGVVDIGYHYAASLDQQVRVPAPYMPLFVRQGGDDTNSGLDSRHALATISAAGLQAVAGMTVVVGPGTYSEGDIRVKNGSGQVTFRADPSGVSTGDLPGVVLVNAAGKDTGFVVVDADDVTISGFHVMQSGQAGIQIRTGADHARVHDNVVFSNLSRGIEILGADAGEIRNNLVYRNGTGGIRVAASTGSAVTNNTVYQNGDVGILVGGSDTTDPAPGTSVLRNVVAANGKGIKVQTNSFAGYVTGFNVVSGSDAFSGNTPRADSDYLGDPRFAADPAGVDKILGADGFLDDDFHLLQTDTDGSPAVDIDFDDLNCLATGSTRTDGLPDLGPLDAGYHYPFLPVVGPSALGRVVFVRGAGADSNSGGSSAAAFASIRKALTSVVGNGLIVVGPGTYHEAALRIGGHVGADGMPAVLADATGALTGDTPGAVTIEAGGRGGTVITGPALLDGLRFTGARGPGLRVLRAARDVTIRHSTVCGNSGSGVMVSGDGVQVINNLVCANGAVGIDVRLRRPTRSLRLLNNTVTANQRQGISVRELVSRQSHVALYNNVISGNGGVGLTARAIRGVRPATASNLNTDGYGPGTQAGSGDLTAAPQFSDGPARPSVDCGSVDAYSVATSSPVVDAGVSTSTEIGLGIRSVMAAGTRDTGATDLGFHYPVVE